MQNVIKHKNYYHIWKWITKFYCYKSPIFLKDVNNENALAFNKISLGEKN